MNTECDRMEEKEESTEDSGLKIQDPYKYYNNRFIKKPLKVQDDPNPGIHTFAKMAGEGNEQTTGVDDFNERRPFADDSPQIVEKMVNTDTSNSEKNVTEILQGRRQSDPWTDQWPLRTARMEKLKKIKALAELDVSGLTTVDSPRKDIRLGTKDEIMIITADDSSVLGEMKINMAAEKNPYNKLNHRIHSILWFPCFVVFFFICCTPAMFHMRRSDEEFADNNQKEAKKYGLTSTILYFLGILTSLTMYCGILFIVIYFSLYRKELFD